MIDQQLVNQNIAISTIEIGSVMIDVDTVMVNVGTVMIDD